MIKIIVSVACVSLGIFMAGLCASDDEGSLKSTAHDLWVHEIQEQRTYP